MFWKSHHSFVSINLHNDHSSKHNMKIKFKEINVAVFNRYFSFPPTFCQSFKTKARKNRAFSNQQEKLHYPFCLGQLNKSISVSQDTRI